MTEECCDIGSEGMRWRNRSVESVSENPSIKGVDIDVVFAEERGGLPKPLA